MVTGRGGRFGMAGVVAAALAFGVGTAAMAGEGIGLELNKVTTNGYACRLTFVLNNRTDALFSKFEFDFAFFDTQGNVITNLSVDFRQLRPLKTVVQYIDAPAPTCEGLAKVLLNDVVACEPAGVGGTDCLDLIQASSRGEIDFFK